MSSEAAQKAYPDVEHVEFFGDGFRDKERAAFDAGAVEALRQAAEIAESTGHHWSGAPASDFFRLAERYRAMADEWVVGQ